MLLVKTPEMHYTLCMVRAYEEIIEFIAAGTSPGKIIAFRPSEATKERVADLIYREKTRGLSPDEAAELGNYLQIEHLMRLTKARAVHHLAHDELH
jgi:hypothetical protein